MAVDENGKEIVEEKTGGNGEEAFRTFKTQKEFDDFSASLRKSSEERALKSAKVDDNGALFNAKDYEAKFSKDLKAKLRSELEAEAKMSEAEKLESEKAKMFESFKLERIELNKDKAKNLLEKAGFSEDEMDVYLDFVDENKDTSLGKIIRICESRQKMLKLSEQKIIDKLNSTSGGIKYGGSDNNAFQTDYDNAKKAGNTTLMSGLIRNAKEKGIKLKF